MSRVTPSDVVVELARSDDARSVADLLTEAAEWLRNNGHFNDWAIPFSTNQAKSYIATKPVYVARYQKMSVATFSLEWQDRFWPAEHDAGYIHRLAVARAYAGNCLGTYLLTWAGVVTARQGRRYLRLDCPASNESLRRYYDRAGFQFRGLVKGTQGYIGARYERSALGGADGWASAGD